MDFFANMMKFSDIMFTMSTILVKFITMLTFAYQQQVQSKAEAESYQCSGIWSKTKVLIDLTWNQ